MLRSDIGKKLSKMKKISTCICTYITTSLYILSLYAQKIAKKTFKSRIHSVLVNYWGFFCLELFVPLETFSLIWRRPQGGLQILAYSQHIYPLKSKGTPTVTRTTFHNDPLS